MKKNKALLRRALSILLSLMLLAAPALALDTAQAGEQLQKYKIHSVSQEVLTQRTLELRKRNAAIQGRQLERQIIAIHQVVTSTVPAVGASSGWISTSAVPPLTVRVVAFSTPSMVSSSARMRL